MGDVADDRHAQTLQAGPAVEDGARIQQGLGGVLVRAVAGVDDGHGQVARQKVRGAGRRMPHHNGVGAHGRQRVERIHQRFAFRHAGAGRRDGNGVRPQALGGNFEAGARARGRFEEEIDNHLPAQRV